MQSSIQPSTAYQAQTRVLTLTPGLYLFQYDSPVSPAVLPVAMLAQVPLPASGRIAFLSQAAGTQPVLRKPGERRIACVEDGEVQVALTLFVPADAADPGVQILVDRLGAAPPLPAGPDSSAPELLPVSLNGHIELQGDVTGRVGGWIGNPADRRRVEGFSMLWPERPEGVDICYSCTVAGFGRSPVALSGSFVGTRRRAAPILGISVALVGDKADQYDLKVQAAYRGCGVREGGAGSEVSGPSGTEPLVGLRVLVAPAAAASKAAPAQPGTATPSIRNRRKVKAGEAARGARTFVPQQ
jgi:hypothetical protein